MSTGDAAQWLGVPPDAPALDLVAAAATESIDGPFGSLGWCWRRRTLEAVVDRWPDAMDAGNEGEPPARFEWIALPGGPTFSVTQLRTGGQTVITGQEESRRWNGIAIYSPGPAPSLYKRGQQVEITYTSGPNAVPADVGILLRELVHHYWSHRGKLLHRTAGPALRNPGFDEIAGRYSIDLSVMGITSLPGDRV